VTDAWGANTFPVPKNNSQTFHTFCRPHLFQFFRCFPQINVSGNSAHFPFLEDAPVSPALPSCRRVGCDSWRLHWGLVLESLANRSVCIPYHDFSFVSFPLFSYVLVYNSFMLLVCFFKCMHEIDVYSFDAHKHQHLFVHTVS